mmetsp:Transcript_10905/g.36404  ORF Transcript_10905/g.36404 Transcript_10905/m.36404 type:complete len:233 (+) Transcript_10905:809-1507(+)
MCDVQQPRPRKVLHAPFWFWNATQNLTRRPRVQESGARRFTWDCSSRRCRGQVPKRPPRRGHPGRGQALGVCGAGGGALFGASVRCFAFKCESFKCEAEDGRRQSSGSPRRRISLGGPVAVARVRRGEVLLYFSFTFERVALCHVARLFASRQSRPLLKDLCRVPRLALSLRLSDGHLDDDHRGRVGRLRLRHGSHGARVRDVDPGRAFEHVYGARGPRRYGNFVFDWVKCV